MIPRLLLFEGPPGGGKSSLSQFAAQQLQAAHSATEWIEEHTLDSTVFAAVSDALTGDPGAAIAACLAGWRQIIDQVQASDAVYCLDGAFFHSTLKLLLAYEYDQAQIDAYLEELYGLLRPFTPVIIHVTGDVERIVRGIIAERGEQWAAHVADDVAQYPCQLRGQRHGIDGLVDFFVESQRRLEELAAASPLAYDRIDTTARDWDRYQRAVCNRLGISLQIAERVPPVREMGDYVGVYRTPEFFPEAFNHPFQIEHTPDGLRLHMVFLRNFRLIEQGPDCFAIVGRPLLVEFVRDAEGILTGVIYPFVPERRFFCEKIA